MFARSDCFHPFVVVLVKTNNVVQLAALTDVLLLVGSSLSDAIQACLVSLVVTVGKVESGNRHAELNQVFQARYVPT